MRDITFQITKWCACMWDDNEPRHYKLENKEFKHKFRILDDDGEIYGYGYSISNDDKGGFAPLDYFRNAYGVTEIQYRDELTGKYKTL